MKVKGKEERQTDAVKHASLLNTLYSNKMGNYHGALHTEREYLKLLMSDTLSTVKMTLQQALSIRNVERITRKHHIPITDKSSTLKEPENYILRHGLDLMPIQTARGVFTVTTKAKNGYTDGAVRRFG